MYPDILFVILRRSKTLRVRKQNHDPSYLLLVKAFLKLALVKQVCS